MDSRNNASRASTAPANIGKIVATYDYRNEIGKLLYQVVRFNPKDFRQRTPDGQRGWRWGLNGTAPVLYRLDRLAAADPTSTLVFLAEGEKDVHSLESMGLLATTAPMGAGKWKSRYNKALQGFHVFILPDNDKPGRKHAENVASALVGIAESVTVVQLPDLPPKGDVSDWLTLPGNDRAKFLLLCEEARKQQRLEYSPGDAWEHPADRLPAPSKNGKPAPQEANRHAEPIIINLADVQARKVNWLWQRWIPRGAIAILDGDPGLGKSTIALDLAARVSRGWVMPPAGGPGDATPADVLLLSAEDDPAATIRPRLEAIGADLSRVHLFEAVRVGDDNRPPVLPYDLDFIEKRILERNVTLVIIDPFVAYLDGAIDAHKDQDVRRAMHRIKDIAERTQAAFVLIRHLNKLIHSVALYRGGGSIAIVGAARSGIIVGRHPDQKDVRILASNKSNLGPVPRSLSYSLEPVGDVARIAWGDETDLTANDILTTTATGKTTAVDRCAAAILEYLAGVAKPSKEVEERMRNAGFSEATIKRARKASGLRAYKETFSGQWMIAPAASEGHEEGQT